MIVLKLGGSLLTLPDLATRIEAVIAQRPHRRCALLVGGGAAADLVRDWDRIHRLGDEIAHRLALQAMSVTAALVAQLLPRATVVRDASALAGAELAGALPVLNADDWLAGAERAGRTTVPHSWQATSDTIAAWLAAALRADELVLLKSIPRPADGILAAAAGHVDPCFEAAAAGIPQISWANLRTLECRIEPWTNRVADEIPMANVDRDWNARYETGDLPWDSGLASRELQRVLEEQGMAPCRALELGCGTGTNAIELARRGFDVTAVDCAPRALEIAREKAAAAGVRVNWILADVQNFGAGLPPFDFVFDRGCYHCCRRVDLAGYQATLRNVTRTGTRMLCLAGHIDEASDSGIPRVSAEDLDREFGPLFDVIVRRPFHFQDAGGVEGPLGWSSFMSRRETRVQS